MQIDCIANVANLIVAAYISNSVIVSYKINKNFKSKKVCKIDCTPITSNKNMDINISKISLKYKKSVLKFIKLIVEKIDYEDLSFFYNHINSLDIKNNNNLLKKETIGRYNTYSNRIEVIDDYELSIYHELFHMASSYFKNNVNYSGFKQSKKGFEIGVGINEGYTEMLTRRFFYDTKDTYSYIYEREIVAILEKIIGADKMQKLYFNANLFGLIKELEKYNSKDEIMQFIRDMDFVSKYKIYITCKFMFIYKNNIIKSYKRINKFLFNCYINQLLENNYNDIELKYKATQFIYCLPAGLEIGNGKFFDEYQIIDSNEVKILSDIIDNITCKKNDKIFKEKRLI